MAYMPNTLPFETLTIQGDNISPSKLIWRRYKRPAPEIVEQFLDLNPQVLEPLATSPYLPVGVIVRIPIDSEILQGRASNTGVRAIELFPRQITTRT